MPTLADLEALRNEVGVNQQGGGTPTLADLEALRQEVATPNQAQKSQMQERFNSFGESPDMLDVVLEGWGVPKGSTGAAKRGALAGSLNALGGIPFADSALSALAAGAGTIGDGFQGYGNAYDKLQQFQQVARENAQQVAPSGSATTQFVTGFTPALALAGGTVAAPAAKTALGFLGKVARSGAAGAGWGAAYGAGQTDSFLPTNESVAKRVNNLATNAALGLFFGVNVPVAAKVGGSALKAFAETEVGKNLGKSLQSFGVSVPKTTVPIVAQTADKFSDLRAPFQANLETAKTISDAHKIVKSASNTFYQRADELGGVLKPDVTNGFIKSLDEFRGGSDVAKSLRGSAVQEVASVVDDLTAKMTDKPLSFQDVQAIDEHFTDLIRARFVNGSYDKVGTQLQGIQRNFRDMVENATEDMVVGGKAGFEALKEARMLWRKSKTIEKLADIEERASYANNPEREFENRARALLNNKKEMSAWAKEDRDALKKTIGATTGQDVLRAIGNRLVPIMASGFGLSAAPATGGLALAAIPAGVVLSRAAREVGASIRGNGMNKVAKTIAGTALKVPKVEKTALQKLSEITRNEAATGEPYKETKR